ncbi:MAG TPA: ABC transporter substrate-binding protein [candidate division Zixibacteria bacterium]|nr:ABC transporter substrate-binding protein [candidate division Zixibacteria bacterium]
MDKVQFPYRSSSHLAFLHVAAHSGSWEKHGLEVEYDRWISSEDAHRNVADGSVEFVSGNHLSPYIRRCHGDRWVYLAQTVSLLRHRLAVRPDSGISRVGDLRGKTIAIKGKHPGLNAWLFVKRNGLLGECTLERVRGETPPWTAVEKGAADAAFVTAPADLQARRAGLKIVDLEALPMVWYTTVSTALPFVEKHPEIVDRFLRGLCEAIAYFKTHRTQSIKILKERYTAEGPLDDEAAAHLYDDLKLILQARPYASLPAIRNVYEAALEQSQEAEKTDPMALWDFHFLRRIDDSGFIDSLYRS